MFTYPKRIYNEVSIGDVGYFSRGSFVRMFNVVLSWNDRRNQTLYVPDFYKPLDWYKCDNVRRSHFDRAEYYSRGVSVVTTADKLDE
jgi:hypothetical protein